MLRNVCRFAVILALAFPAGAGATSVDRQPFARWVHQAYVPGPPIAVHVEVGWGCGAEASDCLECPDESCSSATIYTSPPPTRNAFFHELGHVFDYNQLTDTDRAALLHQLGRASWTDDYEQSGEEWFADAYSLCATQRHLSAHWPYSVGSGLVKGWRLRRIRWIIRAAAAR